MLKLCTTVRVNGLIGQQIYDFFMEPSDDQYRRWWPGTHLAFHRLSGVGEVGCRLLMDEYVGSRRVRLAAVVTEAERGRRIVWQLEKGVRLPVWVRFDLVDDPQGLIVTHTIVAGFGGLASVFDGLLRLVFDARFEHDMDEHVRIEFPRLQTLLAERE